MWNTSGLTLDSQAPLKVPSCEVVVLNWDEFRLSLMIQNLWNCSSRKHPRYYLGLTEQWLVSPPAQWLPSSGSSPAVNQLSEESHESSGSSPWDEELELCSRKWEHSALCAPGCRSCGLGFILETTWLILELQLSEASMFSGFTQTLQLWDHKHHMWPAAEGQSVTDWRSKVKLIREIIPVTL